jgi:hypothetical protein
MNHFIYVPTGIDCEIKYMNTYIGHLCKVSTFHHTYCNFITQNVEVIFIHAMLRVLGTYNKLCTIGIYY